MKKLILISIFAVCSIISKGQSDSITVGWNYPDTGGCAIQFIYYYDEQGVKKEVGFWQQVIENIYHWPPAWDLFFYDSIGIVVKRGFYVKFDEWAFWEIDEKGEMQKKAPLNK